MDKYFCSNSINNIENEHNMTWIYIYITETNCHHAYLNHYFMTIMILKYMAAYFFFFWFVILLSIFYYQYKYFGNSQIGHNIMCCNIKIKCNIKKK